MLNFEGRSYNMAEWTEDQKNIFQAFLKISAMRERKEDEMNKAHEDFVAADLSHQIAKKLFSDMLSELPSEEITGEDDD